MPAKVNLANKKIGKLQVISEAKNPHGGSRSYWSCICECGRTAIVEVSNLTRGLITKCGNCNGIKDDLTGKIFGKLTIIKKSYITRKNGKGKKVTNLLAWECCCECGKERTVIARFLLNGTVTSCGNHKCTDRFDKQKLIGFKKDRWTVIGPPKSQDETLMWPIKCECGFEKVASTSRLNSSNINIPCDNCAPAITSFNEYNSLRKNDPQIQKKWRDAYDKYYEENGYWSKYTPYEQAANIFWRWSYKDMKFEDFLTFCNKNCYYCGIEPCNPIYSGRKGYENIEYKVNGVDRKDSKIGHTIENCVTACYFCNRSKSDMDVWEFIEWVYNLQIKDMYSDYSNIDLNHGKISEEYGVLKRAHRTNYKDGLMLDQFIAISQLNCFYCNATRFDANQRKAEWGARKNVYYMGCDRKISSINGKRMDHSISNIVPACPKCNWSKLDYSLEEFNAWIKRIQNYLPNIIMPIFLFQLEKYKIVNIKEIIAKFIDGNKY